MSLVADLREQEDASSGVELLVENACDDYKLPKDQVIELVDESFASAVDISRMFF